MRPRVYKLEIAEGKASGSGKVWKAFGISIAAQVQPGIKLAEGDRHAQILMAQLHQKQKYPHYNLPE